MKSGFMCYLEIFVQNQMFINFNNYFKLLRYKNCWFVFCKFIKTIIETNIYLPYLSILIFLNSYMYYCIIIVYLSFPNSVNAVNKDSFIMSVTVIGIQSLSADWCILTNTSKRNIFLKDIKVKVSWIDLIIHLIKIGSGNDCIIGIT